MRTEKVYVNEDGSAEIKCPHCGRVRSRCVLKFKGERRKVKIRCKCQSTFHVWLEFRRTPRKETNIQGYFARLPRADKWKQMLITNVSVAGVGLLTHAMHDMSSGDPIRVRFSINGGGRRSIVEKEAVVRWVADGNIGCEFREPVGQREMYEHSPLDFYLMP